MNAQSKTWKRLLEIGRAGTGCTLCVLICMPQLVAETPSSGDKAIPAIATQTTPLTKGQKTLHALNRLTFGPRPGEEQMLTKEGLEAWFEQQLHPESIDDSALDQHLAQFPALKLSPEELMQRYPSGQMIRQMARRDDPLPGDPVEHAIYANAIAAYQARIASGGADAKDGKDSAMTDSQPAMAPAPQKGKGKAAAKAAVEPMDADQVQAILALPADERVARVFAMSPQQMASFRKGLRPYELPALMLGLSPQQREDITALSGTTRMVGAEALESRLERDVYSNRQLQAVMADFWLNHFSVYAKKSQTEPYFLASYERNTILPNALGKFENLLVATAESPAMLMYLDNWQSIGPDSPAASRTQKIAKAAPNSPVVQFLPKGINENYARELLELHTLGVRCEVSADKPASSLEPSCGKGYTQADVQNVAKVLTGWTIERGYQGGGRMIFDESRHEGGNKTVLGVTIKESGAKEGMEVLHMLATSPATAHFVSYKLAVRFVSDTPPDALVDRMAATFLKSDGDIKAVLATMFHSLEFWAPSVYRAKVKTPIEFVASALRASDATIANPIALVAAMNQLGMPIYGMQTPNGYSWQADQWVSSNALISRMNFALVLSGSRVPGAKTDWPRLLGDGENSSVTTAPSPETELKLETLLLGQPAAQRTRATVLDQFHNPTAQQTAEQSFALKPETEVEDNGDASMLKKVYGKGKRAQGAELNTNQPETPLDTMAGLLLGSPDFQRR